MAEIVNLRTARNARKRAAQASEASANRAKFGMTKAEKARQHADKSRTDRQLDGARLDRD